MHLNCEKIVMTVSIDTLIGHAHVMDLDNCLDQSNYNALLVSRPPVFIFLCGQAIGHYSLWHFEGVVSWNHPNN